MRRITYLLLFENFLKRFQYLLLLVDSIYFIET